MSVDLTASNWFLLLYLALSQKPAIGCSEYLTRHTHTEHQSWFGAAASSLSVSSSAWAGCVGTQSHWWLQWQCSMWWIILCWPWPAQGISVTLLQAKWTWPWCRHKHWCVIVHDCCDFGRCQLKLFWAMSQYFGAVGQAKDCFQYAVLMKSHFFNV